MTLPVTSYKRPPVIERVASFYCDMEIEDYESQFEKWRALVAEEYHHYEPLKEWLLNVKEETDEHIPIFDTMEPELRIIPRFSQKSKRDGFDWSIRTPPDCFTMNMHSRPNQGETRRYPLFRGEISKWLPIWWKNFGVESIKSVVLHYVNGLSKETVPAFYDEKGNLQLGNLITVFTHIPGRHISLVPPFDCTATVLLDEKMGALLQLKVADWSDHQRGAAVRLDFIVTIPPGAQNPSSPEDALILLDWAHERVTERFEAIFTEAAKTYFNPE